MKSRNLGEVVVTARESRGMTTTSVIGQDAMIHLQPSSFTDLVGLLPGFVSKDPDMGRANLIRLREPAGGNSDNYNTSSLGTSFVIDGVPVNTHATMLVTPDSNHTDRITTGKGVDMRSLSTDDIESVEIVRGIPSAEYGDLTSGLVKIRRKQGATPFEARFKADMQSQLLYLGKGFRPSGDDWVFNLSGDYLDSKVDPRNNRENFKRVTFSIRSNFDREYDNNWNLVWGSSLNYNATFERDKNDPDITVNNTIDYYTNDIHRIAWNNTLSLQRNLRTFFRSLSLTTGVSYSDEHLVQQKSVASTRLYPMPVSTLPGEHYVGFLPMLYTADYNVYSRPLTLYVKLSSRFRYNLSSFGGWLRAGGEWNCSKNYGKGAVYDLMRPLTAGNNSRPRPFNAVPATSQLSFYIEDETTIHLGLHNVNLQAGLRETQLTGLDNRYYLTGRCYLDPRVNLKWEFPEISLSGSPLMIEAGGGFGLHTMMPPAAYLYPEPLYTDIVQLNYYHNNEQWRSMNVKTFVDDRTNYDLRAARNLKWEIRTDISYHGNRLSITYFREKMDDAFRYSTQLLYHTYNRYDASGYYPATGGAPTIDRLPFATETRISTISRPTNDSRINKEGFEFTFSSARIPVARTRVTVNGAWFRTTLTNSGGLWYKPTIIVNNRELFYAGFYNDPDGSVYRSFNTNITFDTDIPRLSLNVSLTMENMWFTSNRTLPRSGTPLYFASADGSISPWQPQLADDPYLGQLIRTYTSTAFEENRIPYVSSVNLKATKYFLRNRIGIALYVNRIISITPDYERFGQIQRRYTTPYFGMELNLRI